MKHVRIILICNMFKYGQLFADGQTMSTSQVCDTILVEYHSINLQHYQNMPALLAALASMAICHALNRESKTTT